MKDNNVYKYKNLTIHIKREYGKTKKLGEIITNLIIQNYVDNNLKLVV